MAFVLFGATSLLPSWPNAPVGCSSADVLGEDTTAAFWDLTTDNSTCSSSWLFPPILTIHLWSGASRGPSPEASPCLRGLSRGPWAALPLREQTLAPCSTSPSAWSQQICLRTDTASQREGCFFLFFLPFFEEAPAFWSRKAVAPSTAAALSPALYLPQQPRGNISARRKKTLRRNDAAHQLHKVQLINYTATEPCPCSGTARGGCSVPPCVPSQLHPKQTQPGERAIDNHVCRTPFTFLNRAR